MEHTSIDDINRFAFGANWSHFLSILDEKRITEAEKSLQKMLDVMDLKGKTFLDIGSGSGLFSLAAFTLGAKVNSFDYDPQSVACTKGLRRRYSLGNNLNWNIQHGGVLDRQFMDSLGSYDVVYSWVVLHHTGQMWNAIEIATQQVKKNGLLYLAIYNDQGFISHLWWLIKYFYNNLPKFLRHPLALSVKLLSIILVLLKYTIKLSPMTAINSLLLKKRSRGMSWKYDVYDWVGGFPLEFSRYEVLESYLRLRGFELIRGRPGRSAACHEMIFKENRQ